MAPNANGGSPKKNGGGNKTPNGTKTPNSKVNNSDTISSNVKFERKLIFETRFEVKFNVLVENCFLVLKNRLASPAVNLEAPAKMAESLLAANLAPLRLLRSGKHPVSLSTRPTTAMLTAAILPAPLPRPRCLRARFRFSLRTSRMVKISRNASLICPKRLSNRSNLLVLVQSQRMTPSANS